MEVKDIGLVPIEENLVDLVWENKPKELKNPVKKIDFFILLYIKLSYSKYLIFILSYENLLLPFNK